MPGSVITVQGHGRYYRERRACSKDYQISNITDKVSQEAKDWYCRTLDSFYPVVFLDAVHFKVREEGRVVTKAAYVALGINGEGYKDILGIWIVENEGAKFWLKVCNELKNRGIQDILIACIDGLNGFPDAVRAVFPQTRIQLCVIHQIRNSIKYVSQTSHLNKCVCTLKIQ